MDAEHTEILKEFSEEQVLNLTAQGMQVKQIAEKLGISPRTVEVYKSRMTQKKRAFDSTDLARDPTRRAPR